MAKNDELKNNIRSDSEKILIWIKIIISPIVTIGSILWVFGFLRTNNISYGYMIVISCGACLLLISYILAKLSYFDFKIKSIGALVISSYTSLFASSLIFLVATPFIVKGTPYRSEMAYEFYKVSNFILLEHDDIPLEAINEAISTDIDGHPEYYYERGNLYVDIYNNLADTSKAKVENNDANDKKYNLTPKDCIYNAISDYNIALLGDEDNVNYRYARGKAYRLAGEKYLEMALEDLQYAYNNDPHNEEYVMELGKTLLKKQDITSQNNGLLLICKAAEITQGNNDSKNYYQQILLALQDVDTRDILAIDSHSNTLISEIYSNMNDIKNLGSGTKKTNHVIDILKNSPDFANYLINGMDKYINVRVGKTDVLYEYSIILQSVERYEEALEYLKVVISDNPTYLRAYEQKAFILSTLGKNDDSIKCMEKILQIDNSIANHVYYANILYNAKEYDKAIDEYEYVASNDSDRTSYCYYSIGQSYYNMGKYIEAKYYFNKSLSENPVEEIKDGCYKYLAKIT